MSDSSAYSSIRQRFGDLGIHGDGNIVYQGINPDPQHPKTGYFLVPRSPNRLFTGRDDILGQLANLVRRTCEKKEQQTRIAITGLGGLGKSELCLHLIKDVKNNFDNVFWVDVGTQQSAEQGFMNISDHLKLQAQAFHQVVQYLSGARQTWLLVLDNADDPATDFHPFFPSGSRGTVIVTSRNPECGKAYGDDHWEQLDGLDHSLATSLLLQTAGYGSDPSDEDRNHAGNIAQELGCHTLAVILAGSYISRHHNLDRYLDVYRKHWNRVMSHVPQQDRPRYGSVHATFEAAVVCLEQGSGEASLDALDLLQIFSALAASNVPSYIFEQAWSGVGRIVKGTITNDLDSVSVWHISKLPRFMGVGRTEWDAHRLMEAARLLETLSMIKTSGTASSPEFTMHSLLQQWLWRRQQLRTMEESWAVAGSIITLAIYRNETWRDYVTNYRSCLGSYIASWKENGLFASPASPILQTLFCCAGALDVVRNDKLSLCCLEEIARIRLGNPQAYDMLPLVFLQLWARCRLRNGDSKGSIELWEKILDLQGSLTENHPDLLASQHALASTYWADRQVKRSIALLEHVVRVKEKILAEDHPDLLVSQHALAAVYEDDGQVQDAVFLLEHVVSVRQKELKKEDPDLLASQLALAVAYESNGQVKKAIVLLQHVVEIRQSVLTEDHPDLLASQHALAISYDSNGQITKAIALLEHVVKIRESTLAKNHPSRLLSQKALLAMSTKVEWTRIIGEPGARIYNGGDGSRNIPRLRVNHQRNSTMASAVMGSIPSIYFSSEERLRTGRSSS